MGFLSHDLEFISYAPSILQILSLRVLPKAFLTFIHSSLCHSVVHCLNVWSDQSLPSRNPAYSFLSTLSNINNNNVLSSHRMDIHFALWGMHKDIIL